MSVGRWAAVAAVAAVLCAGCMGEAMQQFRLDPAVRAHEFRVAADYASTYRCLMGCLQKDYPGAVRGNLFHEIKAGQIMVGFVPTSGPPVVLMTLDIVSAPEPTTVRVYYRQGPGAAAGEAQAAAVARCAQAALGGAPAAPQELTITTP